MSMETVVAPQVGESIKEVRILNWKRNSGDIVRSGEVLLEIETDKASVEVAAPHSGKLEIVKAAEETVAVGSVVGKIDTSVAAEQSSRKPNDTSTSIPTSQVAPRAVAAEQPKPVGQIRKSKDSFLTDASSKATVVQTSSAAPAASSTVAKAVQEKLVSGETRKPLSRLRLKIAENLVRAQNEFAILTTFNEVDLSKVIELRTKHKDSFKKKNGVGLGFMSFFTRATCLAIKDQPLLNASIDGTDMILRDFVNIGVAVGSERGLVVPVIRNAQKMSFAEIEKNIASYGEKAKAGKLSIEDMNGGTFTISNGGVYGSLLSTPILNPPQSGILGMHNIVKRAMVIEDKIEIRPMMYLALSYDHRIVDGKEAVTFLVKIKALLENPVDLGLDF